MKKIAYVFLLILLLAGCSSLPDVTKFLVTPTPIPLDTDTPQPTVTRIPTEDLFATSTSTPITFTPTDTPLVPDDLPTETPTPRPNLCAFKSWWQFYYARGCRFSFHKVFQRHYVLG